MMQHGVETDKSVALKQLTRLWHLMKSAARTGMAVHEVESRVFEGLLQLGGNS